MGTTRVGPLESMQAEKAGPGPEEPAPAKGAGGALADVRGRLGNRGMGAWLRTGGGQGLPHLARIQAAFGRHDLRSIEAQIGGAAAVTARRLATDAYAVGDRVGFTAEPDLRTAAHEAAHVVQQRAGVRLPGGYGRPGDGYERHAEQVAERVVQAGSAEALLDAVPGGGGDHAGVQCNGGGNGGDVIADEPVDELEQRWSGELEEERRGMLAPEEALRLAQEALAAALALHDQAVAQVASLRVTYMERRREYGRLKKDRAERTALKAAKQTLSVARKAYKRAKEALPKQPGLGPQEQLRLAEERHKAAKARLEQAEQRHARHGELRRRGQEALAAFERFRRFHGVFQSIDTRDVEALYLAQEEASQAFNEYLALEGRFMTAPLPSEAGEYGEARSDAGERRQLARIEARAMEEVAQVAGAQHLNRERRRFTAEQGDTAKVARLYLFADIDVKRMGVESLKTGMVGHTWISLRFDDPTHVPQDLPGAHEALLMENLQNKYADSMGFWPYKNELGQGGYSTDLLNSYVPGDLKNPDDTHAGNEKATQVFALTQKEARAVIGFAESKRTTKYSVYFYNCTTFAKEAVEAAGKRAPSMATAGICLPNALYDGIVDRQKRSVGKTRVRDLETGDWTKRTGPDSEKRGWWPF